MKTSINAIKIGKIINVWINGRLRKKVCESNEIADEFFKVILAEKANPTEKSAMKILSFLNEKTRIAMSCGLETDPDTGEVYLAGFNTPVPLTLVEIIKEYHENDYPMTPIINFWKLLMLNPDTRVRESLFDFIKTHDFVLTDTGYMVVYKAVSIRQKAVNEELKSHIALSYEKVTKQWSTNPQRYVVYLDLKDHEYKITKTVTADKWDLETKEVDILGNLKEMFDNIDTVTQLEEQKHPYTDKYSKSMKIRLGEPVVMERKECNSDPKDECSYGLHVGATRYVEKFGTWYGGNSKVLVCYVNPAHVVAVPQYDNSKMRVSEYFPVAEVNYDEAEQKIDIIEQMYFESDYSHYEQDALDEMVTKLQEDEAPIEKAKKADEDERPLSELKKIIEDRLIILAE